MNRYCLPLIPRGGVWALSLALLFAMACGDGGSQEGASVTAIKTEETPPQEAAPGVAQLPTQELEPAPLESAPVDERMAPTAVAEFSIEDYHGIAQMRRGKPLFVNFWATFCVPCKEEIPGIVELYEKYGENRMDFLAVSADYFSNTVDEVPAMMRDLGMTMPTRILVDDDAEAAIESVDGDWSGVLPATFIYNSQGELVKKFYEEKTKEEFEQAILDVLEDGGA